MLSIPQINYAPRATFKPAGGAMTFDLAINANGITRNLNVKGSDVCRAIHDFAEQSGIKRGSIERIELRINDSVNPLHKMRLEETAMKFRRSQIYNVFLVVGRCV